MSTEFLTIGGFALLLLLVFTGFPTAFAILTAGIALGIAGMGPSFLYLIPSRIMGGTLSNSILAAVPLFIFMGALLSKTGIAEKCYEVMHKFLGGLKGGLAITTILICTLFAATTGLIAGTVTVMGLIAIPTMVKTGYSKSLAAGTVCAGGSLGQLIPPSVMLIMYAPMAGVSVTKMFVGAILPGLLLSLLFCIYIAVICIINPEKGPSVPESERVSFWKKESIIEFLVYFAPPIFIILAVLGTIILGVASPTEASALGVAATVLLMFFLKKFSWNAIKESSLITIRTTSMIIFIAIAADIFTGAFLGSGCGFVLSEFLMSFGLGKWGILALILIIITILGMFIDWLGVLYILIPILGPILSKLGFDPLWTGLIICIALQMSFLSPPFAVSIFYLKGLDIGLDLHDIYKGIVPFLILQAIGTFLCIVFPKIITFLPDMLSTGF